MTADKKSKTQTNVIPNTACALSAVLRFHMTPSQIEDHGFNLNAIASFHCDSGHEIADW